VDLQLVIRAQHGDEQAFSQIAFAMSARLLAVSFRILGDRDLAEDATQQTLVAIWRDLPTLRDPVRFEAWSHRVLVNACYAQARQARRSDEAVRRLPREPFSTDHSAGVADRDQMERAFRRLTSEQRAVLVLQHYLGLDHAEIAVRLGIPAGTVKSRAHAARQALRGLLEADARDTREHSA
jgi:RNA polymerase sigma-70 factor (ECF subfamily)